MFYSCENFPTYKVRPSLSNSILAELNTFRFCFLCLNPTGSNEVVRCGRPLKTDKTRRSWSTREEEVLLAALKDFVANGWKSDNGFRAGYLNKLEEAMRKEFPTTDLKGMPHINSKTTTWKKSYYSLHEMLKRSGVSFNTNGTHMIDCNDEK